MNIPLDHRIILESRYKDRIIELLSNPKRGTKKLRSGLILGQASNCFGTLAYVLGIKNKPEFLRGDVMQRVIESDYVLGKAPDGIIVFSRSYIQHAGLYLGNLEDHDIIFHQGNTGTPYEVTTIEKCRIDYPSYRNESYYVLKNQSSATSPSLSRPISLIP